MPKNEIRQPIIAKHAIEEFGVGWKWLRPRIKSGEIRSMKVGKHLLLERADLERLAPDRRAQKLLDKALKEWGEHQRSKP